MLLAHFLQRLSQWTVAPTFEAKDLSLGFFQSFSALMTILKFRDSFSQTKHHRSGLRECVVVKQMIVDVFVEF